MTPAEMVGSLHRRGIELVPTGEGRLRFRPRNALSDAERTDLTRHRDAILALFDADPIGWRVAVMASQVPPAGGIPFLMARPGIRFALGSCLSCGDARSASRVRCDPCREAAVGVLARSGSAGVTA